MISKREKEIISRCYSAFKNKVIATSGPSWLSDEDSLELEHIFSDYNLHEYNSKKKKNEEREEI